MRILLFFIFFNFANADTFYDVNENDFESDIKLSIEAISSAKKKSFAEYNDIQIPVLKDATMLVGLSYFDVDLEQIYNIFIKYPELKNIAHKFATPVLEKISQSQVDKEIANKLINEYFIDSNLSLEQKILLIRSYIKLDYMRSKCIRLINKIWSETYFNNLVIWDSFLQQYSNILTEDSSFEQAKILLLNKQYNFVEKIKPYIKNRQMLSTINAAGKIGKNNITNLEFLDKIDSVDDIIVISLIDNFKEKHSGDLYYKVGMKAQCGSSGLIKNALWAKYKYAIHEIIKKGTPEKYNQAYELANHCNNFENDNYIMQQFLSGWIKLEHLNEPNSALPFFLNLTADAKDPATSTRGYYWLGRVYAKFGNSNKAEKYYDLAIKHPFYFYGQMAIFETDYDIDNLIFTSLNKLKRYAFNYTDKSDNVINLLTYIAKINYVLGRHDAAMFYTRYLLSLPEEPELKAAGLYRITHKTSQSFAINMGRYGRVNGVPLIDISYPKHDDAQYSSIIKAVILKESMFNGSTTSKKNAKGMMQVRDFVFKDIAKELNMKNKKISNHDANIIAGSHLLQKLLNRYKNNTLALAAYNAGPTAVERWISDYGRPTDDKYSNINWIESIPYNETVNYIMRVTESLIVYDSVKL